MNKHCYRLVFNKAKGRRVVVSEAAATDRHDGSATPRRRAGDPASPRRFELGILRPLTWSTLLALGLVTLPAHAQIAPDRSAPSSQRPHVLESANGTPQVNITAPNTQGVSRNAYRQFDVNGKGAILNNSRTATSTQIGGWVQGNPNLTTGEARVIVNEINSSNPSRLHGAVEIAGRRAEVVIANPAGIDIDGAGFINAQGVTLTTGQPQFRNGALDGYRVEGGTVRIHGDGLDAGDADYAAILARAAEVQAGVWAEELEVVAGANRISTDRQTIEAIAGDGDAPGVAIDVARLGGMYAGKITLVANERGVGVNNAGRVAASQQLAVTAAGRLENRGELSSEGNLRIAGRSGIDNRGDVHVGGNAAISGNVVNNQGAIRAGADLAVTGREGIVNRDGGTLSAGGNVRLAATGSNGTIRNEQNATLAAGLRDDGRLGAKGDLDLAASRHIEANGQNLAAGGFYAEADTVSLEASRTQAREIALIAHRGDIDASDAEVAAEERLTVNTAATLRTDDARVQAERLDIAARDLSNRGGKLSQSGSSALLLELETLDNRDGRLASSGDIALHADTLDNGAGEIVAGGALSIAVIDDIDNAQGLMGAVQGSLDVAAQSLANAQGRMEAGNGLRLELTDTLTNEAGEIVQLDDEAELQIAAANLQGSDGLIVSQGDLALQGGELVLDGARTQAQRIDLQAVRLQHRGGELLHLGDDSPLTLDIAQAVDNSAGLIASNADLVLRAGELTNQEGTLQAAGDVELSLKELDNRTGEIVAGDTLTLEADGAIDNSQGQLLADTIDIAAAGLTNLAGTVSAAQGGLTVEATELDNRQGRLEAAAGLSLDITGALINEAGEIVQAGDGELALASGSLEGSDGLIHSQGGLTLHSSRLVLDGARTQGQRIALQADVLSHREGELLQLGNVTPMALDIAQELDNTDGRIASHAGLDLRAGDLINERGTLQAVGDVQVDAATLDNGGGELLAGGSLALEIDGGIDNAQGQLLAQRSLTVQAGSLRNTNGTIGAVEEDLSVIVTGAINNAKGSLEAGGQLTTNSRGLNNQGGTLVGERILLDTGGQRLNNTAGLIAASDTLDSTSGELDNTRGTLQAGGDATIDTLGQAVINVDSGTDGGILASGALTLTAGDIDNGNGLIGGGRLDVTAVDIANRLGGTLLSESDLTLAANSLDNRGGQLQALGDMRLDLNEALHNQGGLVRSGAALAIDANRVVNSNTQGTDQGVEGQSVAITANEVINRQGAMRANQRLEIDATSRVDNRDGLLSSLNTLSMDTEELSNQDGTLIANQRLALSLARLLGNGRLLSLGDLALQLASDFTLNQSAELKAGGDLLFATTGTLTNRGTLQAGDTLDLKADDIINAASGELSGNTTRLSADRLTNRGLIDGITTRIDATTLDNLGTGRIYGDRLGIQATTLTNDVENGRAAVIAARERLDIGARRLTNREEALLFSAGDMAIGSRLDANDRATGQATRVDNNSATIEALGDLSISAASLRNTNEHFETELQYSGSETGLFYQPVGWDEKRPAEEFQKKYSNHLYHEPTDTLIRQVPYGNPYCCFGNIHTSWREFSVEREFYSSQVVRSAPGLIQGGGNVSLRGESVVNDKSKIVAGDMLRGDLENIENLDAKGQRSVVENGVVRSLGYENYHSEHGGERIPYTSNWESYANQESLSDITLSVTEFGGNRNVSSSGTQIGALQTASVSGSASGAGTTKADVSASGPNRGIIEVPALVTSGTAAGVSSQRGDLHLTVPSAERKLGSEIIRTLMPNVRLPSNSLFRVRPNPTATYLVETDPRFTDRRQWMSSDSLLDRLSPDPAVTHKRLGDGFYEQRLIREQVTELTGQRFLEGYADDQAQYAALMNNAVTFAKEHGLRPGVALSAEQMAQLTSDIVWLVEQTVTLEDGSTAKVLVPQVYARLREGDLKGDGTLIAGDSLQLDVAGDIVNSGTLAGRELVDMTAGNLTNLEGRISGNRVDLKTRRDLTNLGGDITANESLSVQAGRDLNLASTSERMAGLYVTDPDGQLLAGAGRDLTIRGAEVDSAGSLSLSAGRGLDIASTLDTQSTRYGRATLSHADIEHQATLTAGQDLTLNAGRDLGLTAVDVTAGGSGLIAAGRDLALETLTTGNALGGNRKFQYSRQQEVGTNLAFGNDLTLLAGQDLYARAADVSAAGDLGVIAGRDIEIEAGQSSRYEERRNYRKHTIDSQSRVQGSEFSAGGDLTLSAGDDLRLTASRLQAGDNASLFAGGDIEFLTAQEQDYSLYKEKSSGGLFGSSRTRRDEVSRTRSIGSEVSSGGDLLVASGLDQTYQAARLDSGGDIELRSGGTIRFETASDVHTESHERSSNSFAWQSSSGEGFTRETLRQSELVAQGELIIQAAEGLQIDVEQIDRRSVSRTIDAMVAANPDLAWLQEMEQRGDIDWRQVKAIHDSWDYEQSGLGGGMALAVAIVAAAWAGPAASGLLGLAEGGLAASMVTASAGSLASTGAVSFINNRGDLGAAFSDTFSSDSLRSAATAGLTAGATHGMTNRFWGTQTNPTTGATRNVNLGFGQGSDIARFAGQRVTQAAMDAGIRSAVEGGSFRDHLGDSLESAVTHVVSGVLFNAVGDLAFNNRWEDGSAQKVALHALVGGSVAEAMGGDFRTGALAAGASEALVHHLVESGRANPVLSNTVAQLVGIVAAELSDGDVNDGALIAGQVESYNRQLHSEEGKLARDLADQSEGRFTLEEIEQALRGMHNDGLGEGRGANTIVDLHDLAGIEESYFDYGGDWRAIPGPDGTTRYIFQQVPTDTPPELIAYVIEQTGGEDSPYRAPVYRLPAEEATPGQPRDRLTGRPLDEEGRYTVSYVVDGKIFHVPHYSCGSAECNAQGANIDYSDPGAQAWARALDAKALDDLGSAATAGVMLTPVGQIGTGLAAAGTASSLLSGYLRDEKVKTASKETLMFGFEEYAKARGLPVAQARQLTAAMSLSGVFDKVVENGSSMLGGTDD